VRRGLDAPVAREFDGVRALLAEDNDANQMVAIELLARLGIDLDVAHNGVEAVAMAQASPAKYAAILMDMQMPELDGLGATRALRADPRFANMPIIAMTANAMKADLDACLAAGMNDHVTKPIDRRALLATLRRWLPKSAGLPHATDGPLRASEPAAPSPSLVTTLASEDVSMLDGIDVNGTLSRLGIDRETLERMLLRFADGQRDTVNALRKAVIAGDCAVAARHAHAIAGAAGNLGADELRAAAKALEHAGREGQVDLTVLLADVEERAAVVFRSIDSLRSEARPVVDTVRHAFDRATARAALERLAVALDDYDLSSASGALADLATAGLPAWAADDFRRLQDSVDGYDYAEARGFAARLLAGVLGAAS
jgi:two-component system sensor histidine kinase/response regulator